MKKKKELVERSISKYNGIDGNVAYVVINGIVYHVSSVKAWTGGVA